MERKTCCLPKIETPYNCLQLANLVLGNNGMFSLWHCAMQQVCEQANKNIKLKSTISVCVVQSVLHPILIKLIIDHHFENSRKMWN